MRENPPNPGLWGYTGTVWGTIMAADDSKTMQRIDARAVNGEMILGAERPQIWGFSSVPMPPDGNGAKGAEVGIIFRGGDRAHPIVVTEGDRRPNYRPKNLQPGESKHHDDQGQNTHIARDGVNHTAKQHVLSATEGSKPLTTFEANDQWKGAGARIDQLERNLHGLFDAVSRMRMMTQGVVPSLSVLAPILSQTPQGLDMMEQAIAGGPAAAYLQKQISQALSKFGASPIAAVTSVLSGGIEALIAAAQAQIASLVSANPIIGTVDDLVDELAALNASASPATVAAMAPIIQGLIDAATASNPVLAQVANLRATLAGLMTSAGPGIGFLAPQQRMALGLSKSLKLSQ